MIRQAVRELAGMGPLPTSESGAESTSTLEHYQRLLDSVAPPVSDDEAEVLSSLFGPDDSFGLAWTLVHLVETAPGWPLEGALSRLDNAWIALLRKRAERGV